MPTIDVATVDEELERRRIVADGPNGPVPALLFQHLARRPRPLLLLGHGGVGHKGTRRWTSLAQSFARELDASVLMIDGPYHGERVPKEGTLRDRLRETKRRMADPHVPERMAEDWTAALALAKTLITPASTATVYAGYSMGAVCGVYAVAALPEVRAAVFGVGGLPKRGGLAALLEGWGLPKKLASRVIPKESNLDLLRTNLLETAKRLAHCDVLMVNVTDDEIFPLDDALRLHDAFAGTKRIFVWPGTHTTLPPESHAYSIDFLRRALGQIEERVIRQRAW